MVYKIRRKLQPKTVTLKGIRLTADLQDVPKGIQKQLYQKKYESQEFELVRAALSPDDRVLEVGAGIGFIGIVCAKICGQENIVSYEPNPFMKPVIEKNYALNGLTPTLRNKVLAREAGEVEFYFSDSVLSSSLFDRKQGSPTTVKADGISDVVDSFDPSVIVMDVEGAEIDLLTSCDLQRVSKIVIELHPHIVGPKEIQKLVGHLIDCGFVQKKNLGKVSLFVRV